MKSLLLIPVLLFTVACGNKSKPSSKKVTQIFVKGNPLVMVEGTNKNKTSFITTSNIHEFNDFALFGMYSFSEQEFISDEVVEDIEEGQEAEESDRTENDKLLFNMKNIGFNEYSLQDAGGNVKLGFENESGKLQLKTLTLKHDVHQVSVEHYSLSTDKTKMSFLLRAKTQQDGNVLLNITFYKNGTKQTVPKVSTDYHYLYGKGVVVPWKLDATRKVSVDVCPSVTEVLPFSMVKNAFEEWEAPFRFRTQKLDIDVREKTSCKPFSDLNEHSIHYISKYLTIADKRAANPGFAMIHSDLNQGYIFDADIVLLGSEIKKLSYWDDAQYAQTLTHEFGHFLGLDHQFDEDENGKTIYSIMSYEDVSTLGMYDYKAITELYK